MTVDPAKSVVDVLLRFGLTFSEFTDAFAEGNYVLWLGSGISRDRVPNVAELMLHVLEHLRSNIDAGNPACVYRVALNEVLRYVQLDDNELNGIDFSITVKDWPLRRRIAVGLVSQYSKVLDVPVGSQNPDDYLVWTGLDVPNTYGAPSLAPDVEHYCIAVLMLEGLVESAVTANWDGLLEKALTELTPAFSSLVRVAVRPEDFRNAGPRMEVIKFHGCAVRAREDEHTYRSRLIGRQSQISAWTEQPENKSMRMHLETLYANRSTLMVGLSAQDANLHTVFAGATQALARPWPASPPAVVLSEERLEPHHRHLLQLTYGASYSANRDPIADSALLGAYAKPVLLALVLTSLIDKLCFLMARALGAAFGPAEVEQCRRDLVSLRDAVATCADPADLSTLGHSEVLEFQRKFIARLIEVMSLGLAVFRTGHLPTSSESRYEPLSDRPIAQAVHNPDFPAQEFGWFGTALALIARGHASGNWRAVPGGSDEPGNGVVRLVTSQRETPLFLVKDAATLTKLELDEDFDTNGSSAFVVVADELPTASTRSPRARFGRAGKKSPGRFSVASSVLGTDSADELFEAFRLAGGF